MSDKDKAAPVGEREAFEAWWRAVGLSDGFISYWSREAFQAGAAHQRAPQQSEYGDAYQGAREDLAIWKRRALEAESRIREQDQIIENLGNALNAENGPTFMGEPVIQQPQSAEAVAYVLFRDGEVCYEADDNIVISNKPGDYSDLYQWLPVYTTPQPSAGVVMPTLVVKESGEWGDAYERGFKAALREFARLNGKEVGRG